MSIAFCATLFNGNSTYAPYAKIPIKRCSVNLSFGILIPMTTDRRSGSDRTESPAYGFHCNPAKCCLLVHPSNVKHADEVFADSAIPIRSDGAEVLGSPIGSKEFTDEWIVKRVRNWVSLVNRLAEVAAIDPQCAHACLTHSIQHRMGIAIRNTLLPKICGIPLTDSLRPVFSLSVGMGGLGVRDIRMMHELEHGWSLLLFYTLKSVDPREEAMQETIRTIVRQKSNFWAAILESIKASGPSILLNTIPYAREKGASLSLSARPIESED
ncbi:hypothetical protein GJ496_008911 [Pomphorhynchus laevis]|nr:hypothetical protein GJ496_008911 [Pomphorhynchus laevis]